MSSRRPAPRSPPRPSARLPRIAAVREISPPPERPWERQVFPAPDGTVSLVFEDPSEYRMGANAWDVKLQGRVELDFKPVLRDRGHLGAWVPDCYQPWSHDSRRVAFTTAGTRTYETLLYDLGTGELSALEPETFTAGALWAPDRDILLVLLEDRLELRRPPSPAYGAVQLTTDENELPLAGWMATGEHFFTVTRPDDLAVPRVEIFASTDGRSLGHVELAASAVLDDAAAGHGRYVHLHAYADSDQRQFDRWEEARFDRTTSSLLLAAHRPVGPLYPYFGESMRRLEERWVAVALDF